MVGCRITRAKKQLSQEDIVTCRHWSGGDNSVIIITWNSFGLHAFDSVCFDPSGMADLSESDFVVKFWGPVVEKLLMGSMIQ